VRLVIVGLTVWLVAGAARADTSEARRHYNRGSQAFNLQKFDVALSEFQAAFVENSDPIYLFNIAQCQRNLAQYDAAAKSYRAYLNQSQNAPNRAAVEKLIEQMDEAAKEARAKVPPTGVNAPLATPTTSTAPLAVTAAPPPARSPWYKSTTGWVLTGVGVGVLGVGAGLIGAAVGERDNALAATTQSDFDTHHGRSITFQQAGWPLLGVGAALVVGGTVVLALRARSAHQ
jgi:tetratricopeptide (TPR) repeat protein